MLTLYPTQPSGGALLIERVVPLTSCNHRRSGDQPPLARRGIYSGGGNPVLCAYSQIVKLAKVDDNYIFIPSIEVFQERVRHRHLVVTYVATASVGSVEGIRDKMVGVGTNPRVALCHRKPSLAPVLNFQARVRYHVTRENIVLVISTMLGARVGGMRVYQKACTRRLSVRCSFNLLMRPVHWKPVALLRFKKLEAMHIWGSIPLAQGIWNQGRCGALHYCEILQVTAGKGLIHYRAGS